jgi:23S rRNA pseudouridine1911/1915/1917 synthase
MKPIIEWVVEAGDGATVGDIVALAGTSGRICLNGRAAALADEIEPGDRVEIYPVRPVETAAVSILAQRDGIVLAFKPAGLPTETTQAGSDSLVSELLRKLNGGRVHAASRLDVGVSGVVACTLGRDASRRLAEWRARGLVRRRYLAIACGRIEGAGEWHVPLGRQRDRGGRVRAVREGTKLLPATTRFQTLATSDVASFLRLEPVTGRMHQLRAHAAFAGVPLFGDRLYGGPTRATLSDGRVVALLRIALHAATVELPHLAAHAPLPEEMAQLWRELGGTQAIADLPSAG